MDLIKNKWTNEDIKLFQKYMYSLKNKEKVYWTKNILKTNLNCLAIKTPILKNMAKEIFKGNYLSFLDYMLFDYYENTVINAILISKIKDFDLMKKYLDIYSSKVESWGSCDCLSFNIKNNEDKFLSLSKEYIKSDKPFVRRIGILILFSFINYSKYLDDIFNILDSFLYEEEYYVNMVNAWLLCELFIKQKEKTIFYLDNNNLNSFTLNKMIQKCRDSYRISKEDKDMLLKYKVIIYK